MQDFITSTLSLLLCLAMLVAPPALVFGVLLLRNCFRKSSEIQAVRKENAALIEDAAIGMRAVWMRDLRSTSYRNETEVEVKFIGPLLRYLGHPDSHVSIRVSLELQAGRQQLTGEADWVVWLHPQREALFVVEAKGPSERLDEHVQGQARSYAFALGAPKYVLTNGAHLQVYTRGVQQDQRVLDLPVTDLASKWQDLEAALGSAIT